MYTIRTMERPYATGKWEQNEFELLNDEFAEFLKAVFITEEKDDNGDFIQFGFTFNSGLRHKACRVTHIFYQNKNSMSASMHLCYRYGNEDLHRKPIISSKLDGMVCHILNERDAKKEKAA